MQRRGRDNAIVLHEQWYHLIVEKPPCRNPMQQDDRLALTKIGEPQTIFRAYPLSGSFLLLEQTASRRVTYCSP